MTTNRTFIVLTAASYAKLINRSMSTTYRRLAVMVQQGKASKIGGKWAIPMNRFEVRSARRAMVEEIRRIGSRIKNTPWSQPIAHLTGRRKDCEAVLIALGIEDVLVELDRVRVNVGIPTAKSKQQLQSALDAIERMIAA